MPVHSVLLPEIFGHSLTSICTLTTTGSKKPNSFVEERGNSMRLTIARLFCHFVWRYVIACWEIFDMYFHRHEAVVRFLPILASQLQLVRIGSHFLVPEKAGLLVVEWLNLQITPRRVQIFYKTPLRVLNLPKTLLIGCVTEQNTLLEVKVGNLKVESASLGWKSKPPHPKDQPWGEWRKSSIPRFLFEVSFPCVAQVMEIYYTKVAKILWTVTYYNCTCKPHMYALQTYFIPMFGTMKFALFCMLFGVLVFCPKAGELKDLWYSKVVTKLRCIVKF